MTRIICGRVGCEEKAKYHFVLGGGSEFYRCEVHAMNMKINVNLKELEVGETANFGTQTFEKSVTKL
jgi:hypothetical protein